MAYEFGRELAKAGMEIVSGMARGIDAKGLEGAFAAGGRHCAVLGCGVDLCYPKENRMLYQKLQRKGALLSEYVPARRPWQEIFHPEIGLSAHFQTWYL